MLWPDAVIVETRTMLNGDQEIRYNSPLRFHHRKGFLISPFHFFIFDQCLKKVVQ